MNDGYMEKIKWDLSTNSNKFLCRFFLHKYKRMDKRNLSIKNTSHIYKNIFKDHGIFQKCTTHLIQNGESTNLWNDSWVNNTPGRMQISGPLPLNEEVKKVSSII